MTTLKQTLYTAGLFTGLLLNVGCNALLSDFQDADTGTIDDTETSTDSNTDTNSDDDTDSNTDTDSSTDTDSNTDTGTETDTNSFPVTTWTVIEGGSYFSWPWKGYASSFAMFIDTDQSVDDTDSDFINDAITEGNVMPEKPFGTQDVLAGAPLCMKGLVPKQGDLEYSFAKMQFSVNQPAASTGYGELAMNQQGVYVNVDNTAGTQLDLQLNSPDPEPLTKRWIHNGLGAQKYFPVSDFKELKDSTNFITGTMINSFEITVPGSNTEDTPFEFCVNEISPYYTIDAWQVTNSGKVTAGHWGGQAWVSTNGAGTTAAPMNFNNVPASMELCIEGTVGKGYESQAAIGISLNENTTDFAVGHGLMIRATNNLAPSPLPLRIQLTGPDGATDASQRWCANIPQFNETQVIPWTSFNTACWDNENTGATFSGEPIKDIQIYVPGDPDATIDYSFCVQLILPSLSPNHNPVMLGL